LPIHPAPYAPYIKPSGFFPTLRPLKIETNLTQLQQAELEKADENFYFKEFLAHYDSHHVDTLVHALNDTITPKIDCTACGNCCRSLMINVTQPEVEKLAGHLNMSADKVKEKYVETSLMGDMIINRIPCHFLSGNTCSIYEHRFNECRDFPGLHKTNFTSRLFATFMHYGRCPIIYNVIEQLKIEVGFTNQAT